ncbi:hypothetical protein ARHIZOSPH14_07140 [Agromyces rhizosphaerae]|uniref:DUF6036 domain-containing protein n=1 Tax=Agromyces rhizosphaerae TaxID=88374 RepID=A0A9W6CU76_9MICO|nr:DUF6036 family nucleotidyltransferase [Agromyces rhizosphaerae]GLI26472.1 hypothetical protein ARHIZOSPH14_07140 [Agromyces rhizosphaerae]
MNRAELVEAIVAATEIIQQDTVLVIGSQSILGSFDESVLPEAATRSIEVDIAPLADDAAETIATILDGRAGEWSPFHDAHGFYIQGVGRNTAVLPAGWRDRLVPVRPPGAPGSTGLCLDPVDLCVAKLVAARPKDHEFVSALIEAGLIEPRAVAERAELLPRGQVQVDGAEITDETVGRIVRWVRSFESR